MPNPASTTSASSERSYRLSAGPGVLLILATLILLGVGYTLWQTVVVPYQQIEITNPAPLGAAVEGCQPWIQIEHPTWLSLSDQGVQSTKRIVLTLECVAPLTHTVPITLRIASAPAGWLRFLNSQGEDVPPSLAVQIPSGGQGRVSLYPECLNRPTATITHQLDLAVTSISATEPAAHFSIALESRPRTLLRHMVSSTLEPLSAGQLTILGSLVALLWRWWKTWNEKRQKFSELCADMDKNRGELKSLRELYSRYQGLREIFPLSLIYRDRRIEDLFRTSEAEDCLRLAIEHLERGSFGAAREQADRLFAWDQDHWAAPMLGCIINLLAGDSTPDPHKCLARLRRGWEEAGDWPRLRCQMVKAISNIRLLKARKFLKEQKDDPDSSVRIRITWAFSRQERPSDLEQRWQRLITAPLSEWLHELIESPESRNPFDKPSAKDADLAAEAFIWEHPLYEQLYEPVHTVLLAPSGGGKTTARLALDRRFWGTTDAFMLDYTDLHDLVARPARITARRHAAAILRCAARAVAILLLDDPRKLANIENSATRWLIYRLLMNHLSDPYLTLQVGAALPDVDLPDLLSGRLPAEAMNDLVTIVQALGFADLYILVDKLNDLPETHDLAVAEALFSHLLSDPTFLKVPNLHVKLFLPDEWEQAIIDCSGLRSGRVHLRKLEWNEGSLGEMLNDRLQVTGVDGLNRLAADDIYPRDLDAALAREADGSPRRLVELGETLLRLRALAWEEAGRDLSQARLQTEDWAAMLEYNPLRTAER